MKSYRSVQLRDILLDTGLKHTRKWEPGVFIRVRSVVAREAVFSLGELLYSSIGRRVLLAYKKNGKPLVFKKVCGELSMGTDARAGCAFPP